MAANATRGARVLVQRLSRDCGIEWPGGPDDAQLHHLSHGSTYGEKPVFELRPISSLKDYPKIISCYPASLLLRHGFEVYHQESGAIVLALAGMEAPDEQCKGICW